MAVNSYAICDRIMYNENDIKRLDIVVFKSPIETGKMYMKRVIGLPEEHIEIKKGKIFINEDKIPIDEEYIKGVWDVDNDGYVFDIPKDSYLVLGDNRNDSYDGRYWKNDEKYLYVKKEDILAKAIFQYRPYFKKLG